MERLRDLQPPRPSFLQWRLLRLEHGRKPREAFADLERVDAERCARHGRRRWRRHLAHGLGSCPEQWSGDDRQRLGVREQYADCWNGCHDHQRSRHDHHRRNRRAGNPHGDGQERRLCNDHQGPSRLPVWRDRKHGLGQARLQYERRDQREDLWGRRID